MVGQAGAATHHMVTGGGMAIYARFLRDGREAYGLVEGDQLRLLAGDLLGAHVQTDVTLPLASVKLLAPVIPTKILAVALNYPSHIGDRPPLTEPRLFHKPVTCVVGPDDPIVLPYDATYGRGVHHEAELCVVIGKPGRRISEADALGHVFGYTCGNDVSAREWQQADQQWWRAKGADTFGPLGPWIVTGIDPASCEVVCRVNGEERQRDKVANMFFSVPQIVSFISQSIRLEVGDVIFAGTPNVTTPLNSGDICEVDISGIGVLRNPVVAEVPVE
jgi:2-keto-4-pentenoate hydratase/2-oxohepta-3-ene-1,7-dioic acid hydratase in catechol pathway